MLVMAELGAQFFGARGRVWRGIGWIGHGENYIGAAAR
jgi:hypothetical protein